MSAAFAGRNVKKFAATSDVRRTELICSQRGLSTVCAFTVYPATIYIAQRSQANAKKLETHDSFQISFTATVERRQERRASRINYTRLCPQTIFTTMLVPFLFSASCLILQRRAFTCLNTILLPKFKKNVIFVWLIFCRSFI